MYIELEPIAVGELSCIKTCSIVWIASFWKWRVPTNINLVESLESLFHEFFIECLKTVTHAHIGEAKVLEGEQAAKHQHDTKSPRAKFDRLQLCSFFCHYFIQIKFLFLTNGLKYFISN